MNHTEAYLLRLRNDGKRRLAACFLAYLTVSLIGSALSFLYFRSSSSTIRWMFAVPTNGFFPALRSAFSGQAGAAEMMTVLFLSAFTMFQIPAATAVCFVRGASIGCLCALGAAGRCAVSLPGLTLYLAANALLSLTAAFCSVYADGINHAHWAGEGRYARSLTFEFLHVFLVPAGLCFLVGMGSQILLT